MINISEQYPDYLATLNDMSKDQYGSWLLDGFKDWPNRLYKEKVFTLDWSPFYIHKRHNSVFLVRKITNTERCQLDMEKVQAPSLDGRNHEGFNSVVAKFAKESISRNVHISDEKTVHEAGIIAPVTMDNIRNMDIR